MKVSIIGTGAYGIALAKVLHSNNNEVSMWSKFQDEVDDININRENKKLLPNVVIPNDIYISTDLEKVILHSSVIIIAVPMNAVREVSNRLKNVINNNQIICIVTKGLEIGTGKRMSEVVYEEIEHQNICMLSGPSFAIDLVDSSLGLVVASKDNNISSVIKDLCENSNISVEVIEDITGVEICSSVKNIFAIIMGILHDKSESTKATMLTILLNDLRQICEVLGGRPDTIFTYAGLGDFLLTCMNMKSRNYTFGSLIGKGNNIEEVFEIMGITTVEGLYTLDSVYNIFKDKGIEIKSINILYDILYSNLPKDEILKCFK